MTDYQNDIPRDLATAAHAGTSFVPEQRAEAVRNSYAASMAADLEAFRAHAEKGGTLDRLDEEFSRYRAGVAARQRAYLRSSSRCVSTMIAGPSNFPAARMNKRAEIAHKRLNELCEFQERARAAVIRNLRPDLAPIMSGDSDAVTRLKAEIEKAESLQERMKQANAAIRKHAKAGADAQVAALVALGFNEHRARDLLQPDFCGRIGFADFETKNNGANIRRLKGRLAQVEAAKAAPIAFAENSDSGVKLEDDPPENRVRLFFPGKPSEEIRDRLKAHGFRWSPNSGAWQAFRNSRALAFAKAFLTEAA